MNEGVDTTKPVQLTPNEPGTRSEWWVPMADGYMHHVTASVWRGENEWYPVGTINVHIGCGVLITDTVRDGETEWQALARVVYTWQAETREADHAEALTMNVHTGDVVLYTGTDNVTERRMICTDVIKRRTPGRPGYVYRFAFLGHPGLTVSADPWNVRKITREDVDMDHAEALAMVEPLEGVDETPAPVETAAPVITRTMPLGDVHSAHCLGCGWRMDGSATSLYTDAVSHWVESGGHETVHGYRNMWGEYRVSGRFAGDPSKRYGQ